jgi:hypothetical protein
LAAGLNTQKDKGDAEIMSTSYEMKSLRKEDLSLYYYLKHTALFTFIEREDRALLEKLDTEDMCDVDQYVYEAQVEWCNNDGFTPSPTERGRGWVYLDQSTTSGSSQCQPYTVVSGTDLEGNQILGIPEQSDRVIVYDIPATIEEIQLVDDSTLELYKVDENEYLVDYLDGRIVTSGTVTPTYATYHWYYVALVDEWAAVEAAAPPVVVIDMHGTDPTGYQLGGGRKKVRKVDLYVFASNPAERNDIVEELIDNLFNKSAPLYDFPLGTMLEYDGTWYGRKQTMNKLTSLFNRQHATHIIGNMEFENVSARHISLPLVMTRDRNEVMLSDLNAYRSKVSFDLITYTYA